MVQTCTPEHPAIAALATGDTAAFVRRELGERREAGYPPFARLVSLLVWGPDEAKVEADAHALAVHARAAAAEPLGVTVLGPAPQALARLRGQHRWHLLLKGGDAAKVRAAAAAALGAGPSSPGAGAPGSPRTWIPIETL